MTNLVALNKKSSNLPLAHLKMVVACSTEHKNFIKISTDDSKYYNLSNLIIISES